MFATTLSEPLDPAITGTGLPATQNVLLAHCDKAEADQLGRYLGGSYRLFPVRTERQFLKTLEAEAIHVIIINGAARTPQNGIQLCSRLKSSYCFAHLPVILLLDGNRPEERIGCLESGADILMERPLSRIYVQVQIRNLLANRHLLKSYVRRSLVFNKDPLASTGGDRAFLDRLNSCIAEHLADASLNVDVLARLMNLSRPTLYRKVKSISELPPNELIRAMRLNKAAELLASGERKVFEIARSVGFHNRSNFGKAFIKHFHVTPVVYRRGAGR